MIAEVIVTCIDKAHTAIAAARMKTKRSGEKRATASCTMGPEFAVRAAAAKLLKRHEKNIQIEKIDESEADWRKTRWRVVK